MFLNILGSWHMLLSGNPWYPHIHEVYRMKYMHVFVCKSSLFLFISPVVMFEQLGFLWICIIWNDFCQQRLAFLFCFLGNWKCHDIMLGEFDRYACLLCIIWLLYSSGLSEQKLHSDYRMLKLYQLQQKIHKCGFDCFVRFL